MNQRRRSFLRYTLMIIDAAVIVLSYLFTYYLRDKLFTFGLDDLAPFPVYFNLMGTVLIVWMILLRLFRNYDFLRGHRLVSAWRICRNLIPVELVGLGALAMGLFFIRDTVISRTFLMTFAGINYVLMVAAKLLFRVYFYRLQKKDRYHRKVLLLGNKRAVEQFQATARTTPELLLNATVEPRFALPVEEHLSDEERQRFFDDVLDYVTKNVVDEVVLAYSDLRLQELAPLISDCHRMGLMVNIVLDFSGIEYTRSEVDTVGPFNIVSFQSYDFSPLQRFVKHTIDYAIGLVGFLAFLVIFLVVAPAIKLDSPGPIFFVQPRKGKNGRDFNLVKFRTMAVDAEARKAELMEQNEMQGHMFKIARDPRITRVGKILRKTSLDEFPQFLNVLKGDMSIVGTRPPTAEEFLQYEKHHRRRLSVAPGITGMWQVSGRNRIDDFEEIVKLDTWYIDHWSVWLDLRIIFKTLFVLLSGR
ncbi:exopolysaccharide biosynthesis polyprenyl glycosylphosphotransferase [Alkalispirochaeta americana]|uniref:Exopolysaccharide biosynthesis polyprenyl glycosylphosphotransferase n=1 Tax=Alkalispirochaeta americana TaxID=159291 RepID=A0A1N6RV75_9SPIO|nr:sugar transferase [Alkalispirochaeta americana]SIQ32659.1 exopolysaccharide biosynthesis polyprenyl glycosylphosphotransferase [Alkalispirochaeta americana]